VTADGASSLFFLLVAIAVSIGAARLGLGKISSPGSGFMAFGAAVLLGILSVVCFLQTAGRKRAAKSQPVAFGTLWKTVALVGAALLLYAQLLPLGGYNVATFLLMTFVFWVAGRRNLARAVVYAGSATLCTYYVFSKWLSLQFPTGPLGF
jgi:hypothetical protein